MFILFIDLEHVKAKWKWNITIERSGIVTGKLEGQNVLQLNFYNARRVSWMKGIERKVDLSVNKNKKYPRKWLKIYELNQFFWKLVTIKNAQQLKRWIIVQLYWGRCYVKVNKRPCEKCSLAYVSACGGAQARLDCDGRAVTL